MPRRKTTRRTFDYSTIEGSPAGRALYPLKRDKKGVIRTPSGMPLTMKRAQQWLKSYRRYK